MRQSIKRIAKEFMPPILLRRQRQRATPEYATFDLALADSHTYADPALIELVARKTEARRQTPSQVIADRQTLQNLFVLARVCPDRPIHVLELGGACGAAFLSLQSHVPGRIAQWQIVETPAMAAVGKRQFQTPQLEFYDDLGAAADAIARRDLLIAQGVLQYTRDPLRMYADLLALNFDYVYVSRTVVGIGIAKPIITKQIVNLSEHGPGDTPQGFVDRQTSQPITLLPIEVFKSVPAHYRVAHYFIESEERAVEIGAKQITTQMIGFLLERASQV